MKLTDVQINSLAAEVQRLRSEIETRISIEGEIDIARTFEQSREALYNEDYQAHLRAEAALNLRAQLMGVYAASLHLDRGQISLAWFYLDFAQTAQPRNIRDGMLLSAAALPQPNQ